MTILNEAGVPDNVSPLRGLSSLAERVPDALLVVVGTRADAHLAQALSVPLPGDPVNHDGRGGGSGTRPGAQGGIHPRVVFVVLEPGEGPQDGAVASRVVEAAAGVPAGGRVGLVLLVACRSAGLLGVDAGLEAVLAERRLGVPVRAIAPERHADTTGDPAGVLLTDLEDTAVRALVDLCPEEEAPGKGERPYRKGGLLGRLPAGGRPGRRTAHTRSGARPVVLLGGPPGPLVELGGELERVGVEVAGNVPGMPSGPGRLPAIGEGTVVAVLDPYLSGACRAAEERGALVVRTLLPIGVDGTSRFIQDVASAAGAFAGGTPGRAYGAASRVREVWEDLEPLRNHVRGKRVFFTGGTGLEVPLARFLANTGAVILEVGTPRLEKRFLAAELSDLGEEVDVVESPDWRAQLARIDAARPDVVVTSPGLYLPLVARGHLCRSSLDLLSLGVHGYEGARRTLSLLAQTFERAYGLDALDL